MITAELNHNPYLLLTTVRFNGQPPRINSQVEKYESVMLKDWIHKVPGIYHDEMNGYDFDLYFEEIAGAILKSADCVIYYHDPKKAREFNTI